MMDTNRIMVGVALALVMAIAPNKAAASDKAEVRDIPFRASFAGTVLTARIDLNNDGELAGWAPAVLNSNLGQFSSQGVAERALVPPTGACAEDRLEFQLVAAKTVHTNVGSGDQLFFELTASTLCFHPATGHFRIRERGTITGGTGKFAGARSSFETTATGSFLLFDPDPAANQGFGHFAGEFSGTLTLPDGDATNSDAEE